MNSGGPAPGPALHVGSSVRSFYPRVLEPSFEPQSVTAWKGHQAGSPVLGQSRGWEEIDKEFGLPGALGPTDPRSGVDRGAGPYKRSGEHAGVAPFWPACLRACRRRLLTGHQNTPATENAFNERVETSRSRAAEGSGGAGLEGGRFRSSPLPDTSPSPAVSCGPHSLLARASDSRAFSVPGKQL